MSCLRLLIFFSAIGFGLPFLPRKLVVFIGQAQVVTSLMLSMSPLVTFCRFFSVNRNRDVISENCIVLSY